MGDDISEAEKDKQIADGDKSFSPDRSGEDSAGAQGPDRKRAVDADRTGGSGRTEKKK